MLKIKILMKLIDEKRKKVDKVLNSLRNMDELKSGEVITDGEYKRLIVANHDLNSFTKALQGTGIWV